MAQRQGGIRRKSRHKMTKPLRTKGKISIRNYLQKFNPGDKVVLKAEPAVQKSLYKMRFHGDVATVIGKRGSCYEVILIDGKKKKLMVIHPIHLKRSKS